MSGSHTRSGYADISETASMPLAGALVAVAGIRPGAQAAAVAVAAGAVCLLWRRQAAPYSEFPLSRGFSSVKI